MARGLTHASEHERAEKPPKWPRQWHGTILVGTGYPEWEFLWRGLSFFFPPHSLLRWNKNARFNASKR